MVQLSMSSTSIPISARFLSHHRAELSITVTFFKVSCDEFKKVLYSGVAHALISEFISEAVTLSFLTTHATHWNSRLL